MPATCSILAQHLIGTTKRLIANLHKEEAKRNLIIPIDSCCLKANNIYIQYICCALPTEVDRKRMEARAKECDTKWPPNVQKGES